MSTDIDNAMCEAAIKLAGITPSTMRHENLTEAQLAKARAIYKVLGHWVGNSFEKFEYNFCCDEHPDREIAVWQEIADGYAAGLKERPKRDRSQLFGGLMLASLKRHPITYTDKTGEVKEVL